ncbi:hypothetical protein ACLKA6_010684 [Drosophila palustris]
MLELAEANLELVQVSLATELNPEQEVSLAMELSLLLEASLELAEANLELVQLSLATELVQVSLATDLNLELAEFSPVTDHNRELADNLATELKLELTEGYLVLMEVNLLHQDVIQLVQEPPLLLVVVLVFLALAELTMPSRRLSLLLVMDKHRLVRKARRMEVRQRLKCLAATAQVQLNGKDGGTKASSQSGGIIHQSQSEVQANDKGGLADAQSSGPGQTSSQAQIGFRPGQDNNSAATSGGGQASAQSGSHSGQSQSQIHGTSSFGVSYHGAAQSASGTKEQVATYREQNRELFNTISQFGNTGNAVTDRVDAVYSGPSLASESDKIPELQLKSTTTSKENKSDSDKLNQPEAPIDDDEEGEEDEEPFDEYEEDEYYNEKPVKLEDSPASASQTKTQEPSAAAPAQTYTQSSTTQKQQAVVANPGVDQYKVVQNQNGRVNTYPVRTTTESVPSGFRGTVNVEKKFHTKALELHNTEDKEKKVHISAEDDVAKSSKVDAHKPRAPDSYVTVTKSVTGSMDNSRNPPQENKNFQSTYYTKSSTCGYFTFSCNIVYGANGRSKICRPKAPSNGKC